MADLETKLYRVTDAAGLRPEVAGRRRRVGDEIPLTFDQAEYEISRGVVAEVTVEAEAAPASKKAKGA